MKVTTHSDAKNIVASGEVVPQLPPHWLHVALTLTFYWLRPIELLLVCCHLPWQKDKDFSRHYPSGRIPKETRVEIFFAIPFDQILFLYLNT